MRRTHMADKKLIFFIGMMGAGKTTIGRILAQRIGWDFIDMDQEIVRETGTPISEIFRTRGEPEFRRIESELLARLCSRERTVIATGGGVILDSRNQKLLAENGLVIYLRVTADDVLLRTRNDTSRPNLDAEDKRARAESLIEFRAPLYTATADMSLQSGGQPPAALAAKIAGHPKLKSLTARFA